MRIISRLDYEQLLWHLVDAFYDHLEVLDEYNKLFGDYQFVLEQNVLTLYESGLFCWVTSFGHSISVSMLILARTPVIADANF